MTEDSTNRTLVSVMIIIGIVIIVVLFTQGRLGGIGGNSMAYNGGLYTASVVPIGIIVPSNYGYPIITRSMPSRSVSITPIQTDTDSGYSTSSTTTTYSSQPQTYTDTGTTSYPVTYPSSYYPTTNTTYPYTTPTYYPTNNYYPTTNYNNTCPADTMTCSNGEVVGRAGPYCAFTLCQ